MTHTERGLLDDIIAHPAEDWPRLIYADWCEDNGRAERAEFIRVQCADPSAGVGYEGGTTLDLGRGAEVVPPGCVYVFHRGFVHAARCPLRTWRVRGKALRAAHPVEAVEITDREPLVSMDLQRHMWYCAPRPDDLADPENIPEAIFRLIRPTPPVRSARARKYFPSHADALAALNAAAFEWAAPQTPGASR